MADTRKPLDHRTELAVLGTLAEARDAIEYILLGHSGAVGLIELITMAMIRLDEAMALATGEPPPPRGVLRGRSTT